MLDPSSMKCDKCGKTCRTPKAENWKLWQLCFKCALIEHPEFYEGKHKHGVGGTWLEEATCYPMASPKIPLTPIVK